MALVDGFGKLLLHTYIMPSQPIVSYLTPFTGLRHGDLERGHAIPLAQAISLVKALLPANAILVGQNPAGDIEWTGLRKGIDFEGVVDLADVFQGFDGTVCSLQHEARVLLDLPAASRKGHDPVWDATVSVALYKKAAMASSVELRAMRKDLTSIKNWPPAASVAKRCGYRLDGVCLSMYSMKNCSCGKPIQRTWAW